MAAYEDRHHIIDAMSQAAINAHMDRQELSFLECAICLMLMRHSCEEVAQILCAQAEMLLEHG